MTTQDQVDAIRSALAACQPVGLWQCWKCCGVFVGPHRSVCRCGGRGYWSGSVDPRRVDDRVLAEVWSVARKHLDRLAAALGVQIVNALDPESEARRGRPDQECR